MFMRRAIRFWLLLSLEWMLVCGQAATGIIRINYHGWSDAILLTNDIVEAIVVPSLNRVMQFRFAGDSEGPFWENRQLDGVMPEPEDKVWRNFGGDKSWPAPQSEWPQIMDRAWPPPRAFDPSSSTAIIKGGTVVVISSVDPFFKTRVIRRIRLDRHKPVMRIETTFEQVAPSSQKTSVWVVTQLKHPQRLYLPVPDHSRFPDGYCVLGGQPAGLQINNGLISMVRSTSTATKMGNDASAVLWMGDKMALKIDSPRIPRAEYPDKGCSVEVFTSPDPAYIELELLGPLSQVNAGRIMKRTSTYTLFRRRTSGEASQPDVEARKILKP